MEKNFKSVSTTLNIVSAVVVIIAGVGLFFVNKGIGVTLSVVGMCMLIMWKSGYKKNGLDVVLTKKAIDIPRSYRQNILDFLEGRSDEVDFSEGCEGGCVRVEAWYSVKDDISFVQLLDFSSYTYQPVGDVVELRGPRAHKFIEKLS